MKTISAFSVALNRSQFLLSGLSKVSRLKLKVLEIASIMFYVRHRILLGKTLHNYSSVSTYRHWVKISFYWTRVCRNYSFFTQSISCSEVQQGNSIMRWLSRRVFLGFRKEAARIQKVSYWVRVLCIKDLALRTNSSSDMVHCYAIQKLNSCNFYAN